MREKGIVDLMFLKLLFCLGLHLGATELSAAL
jgi:hypothetical protein